MLKSRSTGSERLEELTAPNGWLAVRGLFWLHEGANSAGSDPSSEIKLPARVAKRLGVFTLNAGQVTFTADPSAVVAADGQAGHDLHVHACE